ncbi:MAG: rhodanese-like domain-containing protein [Salinivirgaceae bacterium]|jgi:rhodanese-related sulfurtransferase|nr:rhodanese-like domain-containing protein [Salinivirgaceae bacterium]
MNTFRSFVLIMFSLILIGGLVRAFIPADYEKTAKATLQNDVDQQKLQYLQLYRILQSGHIESFQLIDLRSADQFEKNHLRGAINIPFNKLMVRESIKKLDRKPILLYGANEADAAMGTLLLTQMGVEDVRYIPGRFSTIYDYVVKDFDPVHAFYSEDKIKHCFNNYFSASAGEGEQQKVKKEKVAVIATPGGC